MCADGSLLALVRTHGLDGRLVVVRSCDGGATWGPWQVHNVRGCPFHGVALPDGRLLLTYGYRREPFGVRARIAKPTSQDWAWAPEIVVRDRGASTDLGYPWAMVLGDGTAIVVYYWHGESGLREICATRLSLDS